jgi:hypothetical protein
MRPIDADALNEKFEKMKEDGTFHDAIFLCGAQAVVDGMPTVDPVKCGNKSCPNNYLGECQNSLVCIGILPCPDAADPEEPEE